MKIITRIKFYIVIAIFLLIAPQINAASVPSLLSSMSLSATNKIDGVADVTFIDHYAIVIAKDSATLSIIDILDPLNMKVVGEVQNPSFNGARFLEANNDYAFVAGFSSPHNVTSVDISDRKNPTILDTFSAGSFSIFPFDIFLEQDLRMNPLFILSH